MSDTQKAVEDYIIAIEQLADQAVFDGFYGLQDACLLIVEALRELPSAESAVSATHLLSILDEWLLLIADYRQAPLTAIGGMVKILHHPDLNISLADDEFALLETALSEGIVDNEADESLSPYIVDEQSVESATEANERSEPENQTVGHYIAVIDAFADQAAFDKYYGLQDACLLIAEALRELPQGESALLNADLLSLLADWPMLIGEYYKAPVAIAGDIVKILRYPGLNILLSEDEFVQLETTLAEAIGAIDDWQKETAEVTEALSPATLELVQLLIMQADLIDNCLLTVSSDDPIAVADGLQQLADELERYAKVSEIAGFEGLARICQQVNANIQLLHEDIKAFTAESLDLLWEWIGHVKDYLKDFNASDAGQILIDQLSCENWILPLDFETGAEILVQIRATGFNVSSQEDEIREQFATREDVSLALPDDVNQELLELLLQELPVYTQQFSEAVQHLQSGGSLQDVEVAQRVAHTLKGSANTVGIKGIAVLTHQLEDILIACTKAHRLPGPALADTLIEAADCLESMSECLMGLGDSPADAQEVLQSVLDWANRIDQNGIEEIGDQALSGLNRNLSDNGIGSEAQETTADTDPVQIPSEKVQTSMLRVPTEQIDKLFRLSGESIILNSQAYERLRRMKNQLQAMETQFALLQQLSDELQELIDLKDLSGRSLMNPGLGFDALEMDQYNELHTASSRLVEAAVDAREINLDAGKELEQMGEVLEYQQRLIIDTQEAIMETRLFPVATITARLQRGLRQTCRLTGKQSDLILSGEELLIDGDTLNSLVDPLMHLLRNAVDHGIESGNERLALGKPGRGQIAIKFDREGNNILVSCCDDGRGLDFAAIREAAEKRGVLKPEQVVSEDDLKRLILRPNFSTRTRSTHTSGRGVGLDAVYFQVVTLGGTLSLHSRQGQGLTVELRMPLPLSRSHALLANAGPYRVAIAGKGITQVLYSGSCEFKTVDDIPMLQRDDDMYPVTTLNALLHVPEKVGQVRANSAVLLVQNGIGITAVLLDALTDSRDIIIKNFGAYIKKIPGFIGAAIMGDGSVTPVVDVPELLRNLATESGYGYIESESVESFEPESMQPTVMVVDDSLSQRRALEQLLDDAGFRVITARDGIEAVGLIDVAKPDIVLTDLEMPRMNGIELTSHIRSKEGTKNMPIIMITSRTTQKHRLMAENAGINFYLVKPVRENDLLTKMQLLMEESVS